MIQLKSGRVVPCGKCPACLANQRQEWVFRLKQEFLNSVFSIFVTLTYDDEHIPKDLSVNKNDIQKFHKRLRKHFPSGDLRYYLVSEYGDHTQRPHYHGLYFFKSNYDKQKVYDIFLESWSNGFIKFGDVEEGSIVYCTKYCLKHSSTPPNRKETFRLMSKMQGGLGSLYLEKMSDFHKETKQFEFAFADGQRCRMPKYYKDKLSKGFRLTHPQFFIDKQEEHAESVRSAHLQRFWDFLKVHRGLSYEDAVSQFNAHELQRSKNRDDLVIKHVKKENKF